MDRKPASLDWRTTSPSELMAVYDRWSNQYDTDLQRMHGYRVPKVAADSLARYVPREATILDLGAGTGLVGEALYELGYRNLYALDGSAGMLEQARQKGVYRDALLHMIGVDSPPRIPFNAVIAAGLFGPTHVLAKMLGEVVSWLEGKGGHLVFTLRADEYDGDSDFAAAMDELTSSDAWRLLEDVTPFKGLPKSDPDRLFRAWVFQVPRRGDAASSGKERPVDSR